MNLTALEFDVGFMHEKHGWTNYTPMNRMMRVMGELGEVSEEIQRFVRNPVEGDEAALLFELYDLAWNLGSLAQLTGVRLTPFEVSGELAIGRSVEALDAMVIRHLKLTQAIGQLAVALSVHDSASARAQKAYSAEVDLKAFDALSTSVQTALEQVCFLPNLNSEKLNAYFAWKGSFNRARTW